MIKSTLPKLAIASLALAASVAAAPSSKRQSDQTHNLTPDGYWHNRYHMLLSMAAYGDYNTKCPNQTFTQATLDRNFPNSPFPPWTVVNTFGPTPSGCEGFTAIVPEMNKALIIFKGNYELEQTLPLDVVNWTSLGLGHDCTGCKVNKFAAQGYYECKAATNNWTDIINAYNGKGLVFSIGGHGLGGMHSLIASVDLYQENIDYYSHTAGAPRTFDSLGATYYHRRFDGEAGERAVANNDMYTEWIPESENYSHTGTPFYYWGYNNTALGMNWLICWTEDNPDYSACMPQEQDGISANQSHYFYFANVGECGGQYTPNLAEIDAFIAANGGNGNGSFTTSAMLTTSSSSSSSSSIPTTSAPPASTPAPAASTPAPSAASASQGSTSGATSSFRFLSPVPAVSLVLGGLLIGGFVA